MSSMTDGAGGKGMPSKHWIIYGVVTLATVGCSDAPPGDSSTGGSGGGGSGGGGTDSGGSDGMGGSSGDGSGGGGTDSGGSDGMGGSGGGGSGGDTGVGGSSVGGDNPCEGQQPPASGEAFDVDFGTPGSFSFDGDSQVCQMAGIHLGTWTSADGTALSFSGNSTDPLNPTDVGTIINVTELRWVRTETGPAERADRFTGAAQAVVVAGGPFTAANAGDPVTVCLYDAEELNNINTGETATFPGPLAFTCN
jgi:hypothetical protein